MNLILNHKANHNHRINYNIIKGDFKFEDLVKKLDDVLFNPEYNDSYNICIDITEINFIDSRKNISILVDYFKANKGFFNLNRKCSFITTKPSDVVIATLMIEKLKKPDIKMEFRIFSTQEAATLWMLL